MAALSRDHRLWVPMQLQSLVFGKPGTAAFLDLTPRYEELGNPKAAPLGQRLRPDLTRTTARPGFAPRGIHLHWMLPAAFTHLRPGDDAAPPRAPNRWLVTRLWLDGGELKARCWVVESDTVSDDGAIPWFDARLDPAIALGVTRDLGDWTEPGTADPAFSAFAPGNLGFASFYPSCHGVLGFHDRCDDDDLPGDCVFTYLVTGWFSDPDADPLNVDVALPGEADTPAARWAQRMAQRRWAVAEDAKFWPMALTCYAIAPGIRWTPEVKYATAGQPDLDVAIGGSFVEAAAALARRNGTPAQRDCLVNLQQLAVLDERRPMASDLDPDFSRVLAEALGTRARAFERRSTDRDPDFFRVLGRMLGARARLHERGFAAADGGTYWEITPAERSPDDKATDAAPVLVLPPDLADGLTELNRLQTAADAAQRDLAAARDRLYLAWFQQQYWTIRATDAATPAQAAALAAEVSTRSAEVVAADAQAGGLQVEQRTQEDDLRRRLPTGDGKGLSLVSRAMPRFWRPSDPFVLTAGLQVPAVQAGASPLLCRVSDQVAPGVGGKTPVARSTLETYLDARLRTIPDLPTGRPGIPSDWRGLLVDTLCVDDGLARVLALASLHGRVANPSESQIVSARDAIATAQAPIKAAADAINLGLPDRSATLPIDLAAPALRSLLSAIWSQSAPPRPVYMVWKALWRPYADTPTPAGWDLSDEVDYRWRGAAPDGEGHLLDGFVPIATGLERGLGPTREKFPEPELGFALAGLDKLAGQSLAGLTEALATRDAGPQLRPLTRGGSGLAIDPVDALVGEGRLAGPLTGDGAASPFAPVRGGHVELVRLWIVDSFGRVQRLVDADAGGAQAAPAIARSLAQPGGGAILLPPRLVQAARLRLRWRSARHEDVDSRGDLETSPVCGFVLHNRLDRSLLVYGARDAAQVLPDTLLGAVQPVRLAHGQDVARWRTVPSRPRDGVDADAAPKALTAADIPDRRLRGFVNGLLARFGAAAGTGFEDFRNMLAEHEDGADQSQDQGLQALLTGRPLALVCATLAVELEAPPVADQNWRAILGLDPPRPWTRGLRFPVRLGDRRLGPEGLFGFFVDDGDEGEAAYQTMQLRTDRAYPDRLHSNPYFARADLAVPCDPEAAPASLTLLVDPQRPIRLVSGILPAASFSVPAGPVAAGLAGLEIPFLVAPLLSELAPSTGRSMPLPTNSHDEWRWVGFPDRTTPAVEEKVSGDTAAAGALQATKALHEGWLRYRPSKRGKP